ncbi:hypothetical protein JOB18_026327 [Solea senegalensis]|uniref:Uncharacterized protein n=1 Tax=Solea senegalensis TaxID=28829 RepID=A0AAV6P9Y7_SOLSE|nr:hypothetical protein JOB18_026327 [Solea senegalensis]
MSRVCQQVNTCPSTTVKHTQRQETERERDSGVAAESHIQTDTQCVHVMSTYVQVSDEDEDDDDDDDEQPEVKAYPRHYTITCPSAYSGLCVQVRRLSPQTAAILRRYLQSRITAKRRKRTKRAGSCVSRETLAHSQRLCANAYKRTNAPINGSFDGGRGRSYLPINQSASLHNPDQQPRLQIDPFCLLLVYRCVKLTVPRRRATGNQATRPSKCDMKWKKLE